jgi:Family of unknown function (DUF5329)
MLRRCFLVSLVSPCALDALAAVPALEQSRIDNLIRFIEAQKNMKFIRNGSEYSCAEAARFLRGKMDAMGSEVTTARDFIERIGTRSSMTGRPYQVKFADGTMMPAGQFLGDELQRMEDQPA